MTRSWSKRGVEKQLRRAGVAYDDWYVIIHFSEWRPFQITREPVGVREEDFNYGEGKTRGQEADGSMWVIAYGCANIAILAVLSALVLVLWWLL